MTKTPRQAKEAPAAALQGQWSRPTALSGSGSVGSPGGTHPLAMEGSSIWAVWVERGTIHCRHSADAGASWGKAIHVTSGGTAAYPCSLERVGSALHLIWPDSRHGGSWEVFHKRSADGGRTWGPEARVTRGTDLFRMGTAASGSALHVVWGSRGLLEKVPAGDTTWTWTWGELYYVRSTDGGSTWGEQVRLTQPEATAMRPGIAASGKYVHVIWFDRRDSKQRPRWDWEIYYKRSTDGGATWGPDVRMTDTRCHSRHPQILATADGRVCCIWEDGQKWEGGTKWSGDGALYASVSTDNGRTWREPKRITFVNSPNGRATHAKAYAPGRRIHLVWTDAAAEAAEHPVRGQAAYYTTSADGGLTWAPAQRLAAGLHGEWAPAAVAGTESAAVALLSRSDVLHVSTRPAPAHAPHTPPPGPRSR